MNILHVPPLGKKHKTFFKRRWFSKPLSMIKTPALTGNAGRMS